MNAVPPSRPSLLTRFLWICSGANPDILIRCPRSEHTKYAGMGATVLFTGLLAAISGGYAFYTIFDNQLIAILFGLLWGTIIFNLDRFIVSTIKKDGSATQQFLLALPRFLLAIVLAVVISKPLELRIFQAEIAEILSDRKQEKIALVEAQFQNRALEKEVAIDQLKLETAARLTQREQDYQDYKCECDGTCGTGKRGRGSECARKEQKYLQSNEEYQEVKVNNQQRIADLREEINQLGIDGKLVVEETETVFADGLMARLSASSDLPLGPSYFIMLLILLIEISPLLAKILAPKGPYDDMLKSIEQQFYIDQLEQINKRKLALNQKVQLLTSMNEVQVAEEINQKKKTMRAVTDAHMEIVQDQIEDWLKAEKAKMKQRREQDQ